MRIQTLKEGLKQARKTSRQIKKLSGSKFNQLKRFSRKAFVASTGVKLLFVVMPVMILPASVQTPVQSNFPTPLNLVLQSGQLTVPEAVIHITPGDSNTTIAVRQKQAQEAEQARRALEQAVQSQAASSVSQPDTSVCSSLDALRQLYSQAAAPYNQPGLNKVLEAVHQVETGKSCSSPRSYSGATGPMQFLGSTFRHYCVQTGQGCNINDVRDSVYAAADLLAQAKQQYSTWQEALYNSYNHSWSYAQRVVDIANGI